MTSPSKENDRILYRKLSEHHQSESELLEESKKVN